MNKQALIALLISLSGLALHPEILGVLPSKVATFVSLIGIVLQTFAKSIKDASTEA